MSTYTYVNANLRYINMTPSEFSLKYWDSEKRTTSVSNYFNAGFFGVFGSDNHTLPVANLVADVNWSNIAQTAKNDLIIWNISTTGTKIIKNSNQGSGNFVSPSTLYVNTSNQVYIQRSNTVYSDTKYAVSGVPVMINNSSSSWSNDVTPQGWDSSFAYATWHGMLCTTTNNRIIYVFY